MMILLSIHPDKAIVQLVESVIAIVAPELFIRGRLTVQVRTV